MANYITNDTELTSIANAIRQKGGTNASLTYPEGFISAIGDINTGGGSSSITGDDVKFYDYDGTLVAGYSAADFAALTEMPANPSHEGLTAQGWNWSLTDAKAYVAKYGKLNIGQIYITDDGKTRVYIHLEKGRTSPMLGVCPNGTVDVDWGDDTTHDTLTGTSVTTVQWTPIHNYAAPGDYVIKLTVTGSMDFFGNSSSNKYSGLLRYSSSADTRNNVYRNAITKIEIGTGVTSIGGYAFSYCYSLSSIVIPDGVTSIGSTAFNGCSSLSFIVIQDGITSIGDNAFNGCSSLSFIVIQDGITSIGGYAFSYCSSLSSIVIPDSVTNIGSNAFQNCYSVKEYHLLPTTPPTLASTNAFSGIPSDCIIYVPAASLETYKTATNWSTYASKMQEEP